MLQYKQSFESCLFSLFRLYRIPKFPDVLAQLRSLLAPDILLNHVGHNVLHQSLIYLGSPSFHDTRDIN